MSEIDRKELLPKAIEIMECAGFMGTVFDLAENYSRSSGLWHYDNFNEDGLFESDKPYLLLLESGRVCVGMNHEDDWISAETGEDLGDVFGIAEIFSPPEFCNGGLL